MTAEESPFPREESVFAREESGLPEVRAALPGLVVRRLVEDGEHVAAGTPILVTETMKCEQSLLAPATGEVRFGCRVGDVVEPHDLLASVLATAGTSSSARRKRPRPLTPDQVIGLVCGERADPALQPRAGTGRFVEYDLDPDHVGSPVPTAAPGDRLVRVGNTDSSAGKTDSSRGKTDSSRESGVVVGVMTHVLEGHPEGVSRVWIGGDPGRSMGAVSEGECRRIIAAFDLAERLGVPVEWVAVSAGARIAWDSGTENMDWCAAVVARIVRFTQAGGQVVVVVSGINVGAQSYWNAEATMLNHHRGMLVMLKDEAMVLTGKGALALSGGGSFASDAHIGGYAEIMGPNGQAHHVAADMVEAYRLVFTHHTLCTPRRDEQRADVPTVDPVERDVCADRYPEPGPFGTVGDILRSATHGDRKQAFAIRPVMNALVDRDAPVLERWSDMADAAGAVVWDSRVGGTPATVVGIESRPHRAETTGEWLSGGVLHPEGSRKVAKAINAASGNRPVVVLANLAGFDGSARSMRGRQLEFGAEIARAVTNFEGPIAVVVLGRFHGGAYVVFSKALGEHVSIVAVDGTYVSVIGGDAAAGVVFAGELRKRVAAARQADPDADPDLVHRVQRDLLAREFDRVHDVRRAAQVGSIDEIIDPREVRPTVARLIGAAPRTATPTPPPRTQPVEVSAPDELVSPVAPAPRT